MTCNTRSELKDEKSYEPPHPPFGLLENGRNRFCGAFTLHGERRTASTGQSGLARVGNVRKKFTRLRCKCWNCALCGPRKATQYRASILRAVSKQRLNRMLTLTLDAHKLTSEAEAKIFFEHFEIHKPLRTACRCDTCSRVQLRSITHVRNCWAKLRVYLHRHYGAAPKFVAILEFQKSTGLAHLHIAIDRYIAQGWAKEAWSAVGGGQHVDIRFIDVHRAAAYLSKYLSKELLLSAPKGMRRVTTSRSIRLNEKKQSEFVWNVLKSPLDRVYVFYRETAQDVIRADGELDSFSIRE